MLAYTAACPASYPFETLTRVVGTPAYTFAALFDGCGGSQAAQFCLDHCYEVYARCLAGSDTPERALRRTVAELDEAFFASDLPDMVGAQQAIWFSVQCVGGAWRSPRMAGLGVLFM